MYAKFSTPDSTSSPEDQLKTPISAFLEGWGKPKVWWEWPDFAAFRAEITQAKAEIDQIVYGLFDLSDEEITFLEENV